MMDAPMAKAFTRSMFSQNCGKDMQNRKEELCQNTITLAEERALGLRVLNASKWL